MHLSPLDAERELAFKLKDSGARTLVTTNVGFMALMAKKFMADGASRVDVFATHAIFSDGAEDRLAQSGLKVYTTNSIPRPAEYAARHKQWLTIIPIDELLAEAVYQASLIGGSVSKLSV